MGYKQQAEALAEKLGLDLSDEGQEVLVDTRGRFMFTATGSHCLVNSFDCGDFPETDCTTDGLVRRPVIWREVLAVLRGIETGSEGAGVVPCDDDECEYCEELEEAAQ